MSHEPITNYIYQLADQLQSVGATVDLFAVRLPVAGRVHYVGWCAECATTHTAPLIDVNEPVAKHALMTLAHEAGHLRSWADFGQDDTLTRHHREALAYLYGWNVLRELDAPITPQDWFEHHRHEFKGDGSKP